MGTSLETSAFVEEAMTLIQAQTTGIQEKNSSTLPAIKGTYRTQAPEFHKNVF